MFSNLSPSLSTAFSVLASCVEAKMTNVVPAQQSRERVSLILVLSNKNPAATPLWSEFVLWPFLNQSLAADWPARTQTPPLKG